MTLKDDSAVQILIIGTIIFGFIAIIFMLDSAYGQTTTTTVQQPPAQIQQQVQENSAQIDTTTAIAGSGVAGTIATFLAQYIKSKKLDQSDKRTDRDFGLSQLYFYRLIQTMDAMIPAVSKCLDQPFSSDPMQKHITIRMKLAEDANSTADYLKTTLNASVPSMTPAATVIIADAAQQANNPPKPAPETPVNNNTEVKQQ